MARLYRRLLSGGLGKTTLAAALVRDTEVRRHYDRVAFIPAGQEPAVLELQRSAYSQLVGKQLEAKPDATVASQRVCLPSLFVECPSHLELKKENKDQCRSDHTCES